MYSNIYPLLGRSRKLVLRSAKPRYKGEFALTSDSSLLWQFDRFTETMQRAEKSVADPFYIHFKIETDSPADAVRIIPSVLQSFNRTRTMRRARVSGLRMCNLFSDRSDWYYVSDMIVSCAFDALAISSAIAEFAHIGNFITARFNVPRDFKRAGVCGVRRFATQIIERFWQKSKLARHSANVYLDESHSTSDLLLVVFEPRSLSPIALLQYILPNYNNALNSVAVGLNSRLVISKTPLWDKSDYVIFSPDKQNNNFRYHHCAGFGTFYNNPDYPIY